MDSNLKEHLIDEDNDEQFKNESKSYAFGLTTEFNFLQVFSSSYNLPERKSETIYLNNCKDVKNLEKIYKTDLINGLDESKKEDLKWREAQWGNNKIKKPKPNHFYTHVIECFQDTTLQILLGAAIIALTIGIFKEGISTGWMEGSAIFMAVFIVSGISSYMNWKQVEEFNELNQKNKINLKIKNIIMSRVQ